MTLATILVTGTFSDGTAPKGSVAFRLTAPIKNAVGKVLVPQFTRSAAINPADGGTFSIRLPASDDPGAAPGPVGYMVTWRLQNAETRQYGPILIPFDAPGGTVDLFDLTPITDPPPPPSTTVASTADVIAEATRAQAAEAGKVSKAGDTMTGPLVVPTPTASGHAANKGYVDTTAAGQVTKPAVISTGVLVSDLGGMTSAQISSAITTAINNVLNGAPGALDTLKELADALGDDANYAATITAALALKAPLASPTFTGDPKAPTPTAGDNDTSVATTAFVHGEVAAEVTRANGAYVALPVSPADDDRLYYDAASGLWKAKALTGTELFYTEFTTNVTGVTATTATDVATFTGTIASTPSGAYYVKADAWVSNNTASDAVRIWIAEQIDGGSWTQVCNAVSPNNPAAGAQGFRQLYCERRRSPGSGHVANYKVQWAAVTGGTVQMNDGFGFGLISTLKAWRA